MTDIANVIMYGCFIIAFLIWVRISIKNAAKEELLQIRIDFTEALEKSVQDLMDRLESVKNHCMKTSNDNAKEVMGMIKELENDIKDFKK